MDHSDAFDAITADSLRAIGGHKWTAFPGALGAWVAEMDFGIAAPITAALHDVVDQARFGYNPNAVVDDMQQAFTAWYGRRYDVSLRPDQVRPLPDVLAGMAAVIDAYTTPGSPVIVPTPAYMPFLTLPTWSDREVLQVPLVLHDGRYVYDLEALAAAFDRGAEMLTLCNPHNPIGRVLERAELLAIADVVEAKKGLVFADEIHAPLVYAGHRHEVYAALDERTATHTITATSASKAFNIPGLKCAQIVFTNPDHAQTWVRAGRWVEQGASLPGLIANTVAYTEGEPWLADIVAYLDRNRHALTDLVAGHLPGVGYREPEGTYLALLDFRDTGLGPDPAEIIRAEAAVALTPGTACGTAGLGHARLNFATPLPVLTEIVERIGSVVRSRP